MTRSRGHLRQNRVSCDNATVSDEVPLEETNDQVEARSALVSVIIPCYKQAHFLPEAIESVLAQTYPEVEIIVIDDGSPDATAEVASRYQRIRYLRQENKGRAEARNAGFRACRGEYVIFLDADDRLTPPAVKAHLRCFAAHPEAGFVVGDIDHIRGDGSYLYSPRWPILTTNHYEELLRVNHVANTMAVMFRRSLLEALDGFRIRYEPAEDYEILLRAARLLPSAHHRTIVAQYRRHTTNTSRRGALMLRATHRVMSSQLPQSRGNRELESAWREGSIYWQEHFGAVTIKEIYGSILRFRLLAAAHSAAVLVWHLRGRLALLPWKNRHKLLNAIRKPHLPPN